MFLQLKGEAVRVMTSRLLAVGTTLAVLLPIASSARAGLVAGDIAIIGVNTDNPDSFAWLPLVDLAPGQVIHFTDAGWHQDGKFAPNEGIVTYTSPSTGISAGTLMTFEKPSSGSTVGDYQMFSTGAFGFNLSSDGDQVFAYTGPTTDPTFLFAVQTNSTEFQTEAVASASSTLPPGLTINHTAVAVGVGPGHGDEIDNAFYNGVVTSGTREELLAAIGNPMNWVKSQTPFDLSKGAALPGDAVAQYTVQSGVSAVPEGNGLVVGSAVLAIAAVAGVVGLRRRRAVRVSAPELQPVI